MDGPGTAYDGSITAGLHLPAAPNENHHGSGGRISGNTRKGGIVNYLRTCRSVLTQSVLL